MPTNYYISDTHFGHANILKFDNRPFKNVKEMEEALIYNWNSTVNRGDTVYILGDFCWGKEDEWKRILNRLTGNKVLIRGNHDLTNMSSTLKGKFLDIKDYKEVKANGMTTILSHYPILAYKHDYDPNVFMLYGHVHVTKEATMVKNFIKEIREDWATTANNHTQGQNRGQCINVGCMLPYMNYTPQPLDYLVNCLDKGIIV